MMNNPILMLCNALLIAGAIFSLLIRAHGVVQNLIKSYQGGTEVESQPEKGTLVLDSVIIVGRLAES